MVLEGGYPLRCKIAALRCAREVLEIKFPYRGIDGDFKYT